jgi:hypothetical protein
VFVVVDVFVVVTGCVAAFGFLEACADLDTQTTLSQLFRAMVIINAIGTGVSLCALGAVGLLCGTTPSSKEVTCRPTDMTLTL